MIGFTYAQLFQAMQDWPVNQGANYIGNIPRFVELGELRLVRDLNLEIFDVLGASTLAQGGSSIVKPPELIATRTLLLTPASGGASFPIFKRSWDFVQNFASLSSVTAPPRYYAETDLNTWNVGQAADQVYSVAVRFLQRPVSVVVAGTSWLADRCGDVLFLAALMEAELYVKADDRFSDLQGDYQAKLQVARLELRNSLREGDYAPVKAAAALVQG